MRRVREHASEGSSTRSAASGQEPPPYEEVGGSAGTVTGGDGNGKGSDDKKSVAGSTSSAPTFDLSELGSFARGSQTVSLGFSSEFRCGVSISDWCPRFCLSILCDDYSVMLVHAPHRHNRMPRHKRVRDRHNQR